MCFNLPFFQTGSKPVDDALYQLVEKLNATEFGAYAVFKEAENAINSEQLPNVGASDTAKSQLAGYAALRDLIVKTGDYAINHSETIERTLSGSYVTKSDFGTYKEETEQRITEDEYGITRLFTYSAGINNDDGEWSVDTKQFIKTGLLFYDGGVPQYGVGIGIIDTTVEQGEEVIDRQTSKLLTATATEIAFWEQATKVAYIQSGAINFPNANITGGSVKIGGTSANPNFGVGTDGTLQVNATTESYIRFDYNSGESSFIIDSVGIHFNDNLTGGASIGTLRGSTSPYKIESYVEAENIQGYKYFTLGTENRNRDFAGIDDDGFTTLKANYLMAGDEYFEQCVFITYGMDSSFNAHGGIIQLKAKDTNDVAHDAIKIHSIDNSLNYNPSVTFYGDRSNRPNALVNINAGRATGGVFHPSISLGDGSSTPWTMLQYDGERKVYFDKVIWDGKMLSLSAAEDSSGNRIYVFVED